MALEIYNAINDTHYDNPEDVIITTLENAVYLGMKNDVSFIIGSELVLFEQQSTNNPNMPLRNLFYVTCMLAALTMNTNIYGSKLIRIPEPKFIVFYNGLEELPEQFNMSLSDAYEKKSQDISLELKVKVLNVNRGYNDSLMKKSPTLYQYMMFVDTVRRFQKNIRLNRRWSRQLTNVYEREYFRIFSEKAVRRLCECGYLNMIRKNT